MKKINKNESVSYKELCVCGCRNMVKWCANQWICFHMLNATELHNPRSKEVPMSKIYLTNFFCVSRLLLKTFMKFLDEFVKRIISKDGQHHHWTNETLIRKEQLTKRLVVRVRQLETRVIWCVFGFLDKYS